MREGKATQDETIRRYLLGDLTGEESRRVDERLMSDDDFFREVLDAEGELADEYARASLSARERERFETHFLAAPERHEDAMFAAALRSHVAANAPRPPAGRGAAGGARASRLGALLGALRPRSAVAALALASAVLAVSVLSIWLLAYRAARTHTSPVETARQEPPRAATGPREVALPSPVEQAGSGPLREGPDAQGSAGVIPTPGRQAGEAGRRGQSPPRIVALTLTPGLTRAGGETERVVLPADARATIRLRLKLAENFNESYRAEILTAEGVHVSTLRRLRARRTPSGDEVVVVDVPARLLTRGDYQVRLSGLGAGGEAESAGRYYFRASKD